MANEAVEAVKKALGQPKQIEVDGQKVENHSLGDVISAAKFLASSDAARSRFPVRVTRMISGGAV